MANSSTPDRLSAPERIGLPTRPFLYTLDQIAGLIGIAQKTLEERYIWFENRSIGIPDRHIMTARNIAHPEAFPDWRVAEAELVRWLRVKGFKIHDTVRIRR